MLKVIKIVIRLTSSIKSFNTKVTTKYYKYKKYLL